MVGNTIAFRLVSLPESTVLHDIDEALYVDAHTPEECDRSKVPGVIATTVDEMPRRQDERPRDLMLNL